MSLYIFLNHSKLLSVLALFLLQSNNKNGKYIILFLDR